MDITLSEEEYYKLKYTGEQVEILLDKVEKLESMITSVVNNESSRAQAVENGLSAEIASLQATTATLSSQIQPINGIREISIDNLDMGWGLDAELSPSTYAELLSACGMYRVMKKIGNKFNVCVGFMYLYADDMRHAIFQRFETHYDNLEEWSHTQSSMGNTFVRQYIITDGAHRMLQGWSDWENYTENVERRLGATERSTNRNATMIDGLDTYRYIVSESQGVDENVSLAFIIDGTTIATCKSGATSLLSSSEISALKSGNIKVAVLDGKNEPIQVAMLQYSFPDSENAEALKIQTLMNYDNGGYEFAPTAYGFNWDSTYPLVFTTSVEGNRKIFTINKE